VTAAECGDASTAGGRPAAGIAIGATLGPYVVRRWLGQGGMGTVYAAEDPRLGRVVALKVLHRGADDRVHRARVLREAQALARLSHPHVVPVYDVGVEHGTIWVAMELVDGPALSRWLGDAPPWERVLDAFVQAGRGLAAAHAAGIVHRDFKPHNAMIHPDGRVVVLDFGLAWAPGVEGAAHVRTEDAARDDGRPRATGRDPLGFTLTDAGSVVGTVQYMAPEQHSRREVDARADQYALCVSLFEGLFGRRPFAGGIDELVQRKLAGPPVPPEGAMHVPPRIWRVVARGLDPLPERRWPSIEALVDALERARAGVRGRRRTLVVTGGIGIVAALAAMPEPHAPDPCGGLRGRIDAVWSPARREAIANAFAATGKPSASDMWSRTDVRIDAALMRWRDRALAACTAAASDEGSTVEVAAALACADQGLEAVEAALGVLETPDEGTVARALLVVDGLPRADCSGSPSAAQDAPTRHELQRAFALQRAGRLPEAAALAQEVLIAAHEADDARGVAAALLLLGGTRMDLGQWDDAESTLSDALWSAIAASDDMLATTAATKLVHLCAYRYDPACAEPWLRQADASLARVSDDPDRRADADRLAGRLDLARGDIALRAGRHDEALEFYHRALAAVDAAGDGAGLEAAAIVSSLGTAHALAGRHEQALAEFERAAWIEEGVGGREHTGRAAKLEHVASSLYALGRIDEARARFEEALAIVDAAYGPDHLHAVRMRGNLVLLWTDAGLLDEALALAQRVVEQKRRLFGPDDVQVAMALHNEGLVLARLQRHAPAVDRFERALAIWEAALGPEHIALAHPLSGLAETWIELARADLALAAGRRALAIQDAHRESPSPELLFAIARAAWATGDADGARDAAARAIHLSATDRPSRPGQIDRATLLAWVKSHGGHAGMRGG